MNVGWDLAGTLHKVLCALVLCILFTPLCNDEAYSELQHRTPSFYWTVQSSNRWPYQRYPLATKPTTIDQGNAAHIININRLRHVNLSNKCKNHKNIIISKLSLSRLLFRHRKSLHSILLGAKGTIDSSNSKTRSTASEVTVCMPRRSTRAKLAIKLLTFTFCEHFARCCGLQLTRACLSTCFSALKILPPLGLK